MGRVGWSALGARTSHGCRAHHVFSSTRMARPSQIWTPTWSQRRHLWLSIRGRRARPTSRTPSPTSSAPHGLDTPAGQRRPGDLAQGQPGTRSLLLPQAKLPAGCETDHVNFADSGETKKRTPEADDLQGSRDLPLSKDPGNAACHYVGDGGGARGGGVGAGVSVGCCS